MRQHWAPRIPALMCALIGGLSLGSCGARDDARPTGNRADAAETAASGLVAVPLRVASRDGKAHSFIVEVAVTPADQQRGLSGRESVPVGRGMLFPFAYPETANFWMKDTAVPLDLLFVRPDGTIAAILPGEPEDLHPITAAEPVSAVVEIAGGSAATLGIMAGDHVQWGQCPADSGRPDAAWDAFRFCPPLRVMPPKAQ